MNTSKLKQRAFHAVVKDTSTAHTHNDSGQITSAPQDTQESFVLAYGCCGDGKAVARVTAVDRDQYIIRNAEGELPAELTGKFIYTRESPTDLPCVGDWVCVQYHDSGTRGSIHEVLPRKSFLRRKSPGKGVEFQMIAANIDVAFIVQSCHFDFNVRRLERYLVMVREGHIEPVILLTKVDLISSEALEQLVEKIRHAGISISIIALSTVTRVGIDEIWNLIVPGKTYCLLGSSGTGKTTLTNHLLGDAILATKTVSHTGEGKHTTTRRQLIVLEGGGLLIDMPGMRELGLLGASEGIDDSFADIQAYSENCRFSDCTHTNEPGCVVQKAIAEDELDAGHFQSYLKLKKEAEFHDMSYLEKRRKDRTFGKFVRSIVKARGRHNQD